MEYQSKKTNNANNILEQEIQFDKHSNMNSFDYPNVYNNNKSASYNNSELNKNMEPNLAGNESKNKLLENLDYENDNQVVSSENLNDNKNANTTNDPRLPKQKHIKEYHSDVNLYGLSIQNNQNNLRLAVSSLEAPNYNIHNNYIEYKNNSQIENKIEIVEYSHESDKMRQICSIPTLFPQSKLCWCPAKDNINLLASTAEILRMYKFNDLTSKISPLCDLTKKNKKNCGPLTAMDWNKINPNLVGVCSVDTTCTIWDLEKQDITTHLIAHDSEVFDISFGNSENTFISTGADGSIRLFDLRNLETCSVLFESQDESAINRISWNTNDNNYIACSTQDKNFIFIIDIRILNTPIAYLTYHTNLINAMAWAPGSYSHICSVSDDKTALIWDIQMIENRTEDPILCYKGEKEIDNCAWAEPHEDWIAINSGNTLKMLKVI